MSATLGKIAAVSVAKVVEITATSEGLIPVRGDAITGWIRTFSLPIRQLRKGADVSPGDADRLRVSFEDR